MSKEMNMAVRLFAGLSVGSGITLVGANIIDHMPSERLKILAAFGNVLAIYFAGSFIDGKIRQMGINATSFTS